MRRSHKSLFLLTSILDILVFGSISSIGIVSSGDNYVGDDLEDNNDHDDDDEDEEEDEEVDDDEDDED